MKTLLSLLCLFAAACNSCTPLPGPAPEPPTPWDVGPGIGGASPEPSVDAGPPAPEPDTTPGVRLACDAITAAHCPEGGPSCYRVLQRAVDARLTPIPLDCYVAAKTKEAVRACGPFVPCP